MHQSRTRAGGGHVLVALALVACSVAIGACQPAASPIASDATTTLNPTVRDAAGLTAGFEVVAADHLALSAGVLVPGDASTEAVLEWSGLSCELLPTITVSGALPDRVTIRVDRGPIANAECLDTSAGRAIKLRFSEPIDTAATDVDVFPGLADPP